MMKVAIIGYGIDGQASAKYWATQGDEVTVCDKNTAIEIPDTYQKRVGPDYMKDLEVFDVIVRTSGIHPKIIAQQNPDHPEIMDRVTTGLNEFLRVCPSRNIIGITGTKGKGTTSTLIAKMLAANGLQVHLCGNIGIAPLEVLSKVHTSDWVVLELSSFQLIDLKRSVPTAVCLMVAPDHLDWHDDMDEYVSSKAQLFKLQESSGRAIFNRLSPLSIAIVSHSSASKESYECPPEKIEPSNREGAYVSQGKIHYNEIEIMPIAEVVMSGRHNLENICAAITVVWPIINGNLLDLRKAPPSPDQLISAGSGLSSLDVAMATSPSVKPLSARADLAWERTILRKSSLAIIRSVISSFTGLKHHLEFINEMGGVKYYDDSYSTMPDATIAALAAIIEPKVLILGGGSKELDLTNMVKAVSRSNVRHVVLQGSLAQELQKMLEKAGFTNFSHSENTMSAIVAEAKKYAEPGDVVLLSPGLPAKGDGYFIDNVDRGNQFKQIVNNL
ncbi:UDP-N-acetylmuramoyl-L-alanine--D-glutamate ligase [Candidatus Saccharibacteria bacterium]|nr:UDP-N-acetylmuramoyl-L-alanine--D-glutamate ligase [Candidatus Saccharibacteria bacterium]MBI3337961.1 UDP-N-acetylmuramoyl-L-alanine--D-glutamate ligase [Candidatus Saccharibacteria bacterium]